ncbi:MAG: hypothetical protein IKQ16_09935 [Lentisphaeria bacterium]|nr:hypothetical protein [Lentisphaeria bacterium]
MKQQKLVYVSMRPNAFDKSVELPLQKYLDECWTIESYQPVATHDSYAHGSSNDVFMNVVVLLTKGN